MTLIFRGKVKVKFYFDLQRFDDEQPLSQETQQQQGEQMQIPEELEGIPEDIARDAMAEWEESKPKSNDNPAQPTQTTYSQEEYQTVVNEREQLKAQLQQQQQQQQQQRQTPQSKPSFEPPPIKITPEISAKITEVITEEAKTMTGFTDDDVASLDYADNDDPRLAQWAQAKNLAQDKIYRAIRDAQNLHTQRARQFYDEQTLAIQHYNEFTKKEMEDKDYPSIVQYATNDYFKTLTTIEQKALANAYFNVERNLASPVEMLYVQNYYTRAKAAYRSRNTSKPTSQNQIVSMPRIDQIGGSAGTGEITVGELEKMLETTDFDKIPEPYQKRLLGY